MVETKEQQKERTAGAETAASSSSSSAMTKGPDDKKARWVFPDNARVCPRCRTTDTEAYSTDTKNGRQYRRCQRAVCRWRYSVNGRRTGG